MQDLSALQVIIFKSVSVQNPPSLPDFEPTQVNRQWLGVDSDVISKKNPKMGWKNRNFFNTGRDPSGQPQVTRSNPQPPASHVHPLTTPSVRRLCLNELFVLAILCSSNFEMSNWNPKRIQMKKLSTTKFYNFSRSTILGFVISPSEVIWRI
jgi:hypothetical protein